MADEDHPTGVGLLRETLGKTGQRLQAVLKSCRLGAFAEPHLVGIDHAIALGGQDRGGAAPGLAAEVLVMQQGAMRPLGVPLVAISL